MIGESDGSEALMDPWCTVAHTAFGEVLFGFAKDHHRTGGRAWTRSSLLVTLDEGQGWAKTFSGTLFRLGERFQVQAVTDYGTEARLAFKLLFDEGAVPGDLTPLLQTREMGGNWLTACKVARHLGLGIPQPVPDETMAFLRENGSSYQRLRCSTQFCA